MRIWRSAQELKAPEKQTLPARNGLGGGGGQLAAQVGFVKCAVADARVVQGFEALGQARSVADAADDERGMFEMGRKEGPGGLDGGVASLHGLLRAGQVPPHQHVDIGPIFDLVELHDDLRYRKLRPAGLEPALTRF